MAKNKVLSAEQFQIVIRGNVPPSTAGIPQDKKVAWFISVVHLNVALVPYVEGVDIAFGEMAPSAPPPQ